LEIRQLAIEIADELLDIADEIEKKYLFKNLLNNLEIQL